ncbi:extracellular elastinolytic metalloproteinase [Diaporthe amygdali]|uniref:extracellular elastinolytic metalloproteinase n=1 Tax=Phomopsis amygdali TaxID=1214568 RepID=UPI0022FEE0FD|nr:extracellular elastinolytic metalloproteinase [Diaporthe amygdali]KAJ0107480.1 extracellular elastinolytic metalloproteinase [Diaporthe amygdali]
MLSNCLFWLSVAISLAAARPSPRNASRVDKRAALLSSQRLNTVSTFTTLDESGDSSPTKRQEWNADPHANDLANGTVPYYVQAATLRVQKVVPSASLRIEDGYYIGTNGVGHVHFQQMVDGIDIDTAYFNVNILENGTVLSYGHSFHSDASPTPKVARKSENTVTPLEAFENAVKLLNLPIEDGAGAAVEKIDGLFESYTIKLTKGCVADPTAKLVYVNRNASLILTWRIETDFGSDWLMSYIDAASGNEVVGAVEHTNGATYEAFPWGTMNPDEGSRELIANPEDKLSSPFGWHSDGNQSYTTLSGNNAYVTIGDSTSSVPDSPSLAFSYPYSPSTTDWQSYVNASATQAFYTVNKFHDILYTLGFTETAGNFQVSNNGKGGLGGDPVQIIVQSSTGSATMTTPADGSSPRLTMGVWTGAGTPYRDSVFDSTVLLHEYMHGVTVRLVGGPTISGCLSSGTTDGLSLNEGFSDFVPTLLRVKAGDTRNTDYTIADWATGAPIGLRSHYISTSLQTTPLTFESLNVLSSSGGFDLATVWATALYEVFWNLVDTYGIGDVDKVTLGADGLPQGARYLLLKLILDSDALMPCSANHLQARDALLQADRVLSGGTNQCAIWKGFAKRGFGQDAVRGSGSETRVNGFVVPSNC